MDSEGMKNLIAKITTSIIYAQCTEALNPGTFQTTIDNMFRLNNIPTMRFPTENINQGLLAYLTLLALLLLFFIIIVIILDLWGKSQKPKLSLLVLLAFSTFSLLIIVIIVIYYYCNYFGV